jgi:hypothetical protein
MQTPTQHESGSPKLLESLIQLWREMFAPEKWKLRVAAEEGLN